jgi:hypothetical protein
MTLHNRVFPILLFTQNSAKNGIFYTVHSEEKNNRIPDFPVTKGLLIAKVIL